MQISNRLLFSILVIGFPVFVILHGVNENIGLIPVTVIFRLLIYYLIVAAGIATLSKIIMKKWDKALVFGFFLLIVFFFFGVFKDLSKQINGLTQITSYRYLLPAIAVVVISAGYLLKRTSRTFARVSILLATILVANLALETGMFFYNSVTGKAALQDFGDRDHKIIEQVKIPENARKPHIFWIVFDEYSGSRILKDRWNFVNPLDSTLRNRGFFVADSAMSSYNYTHYSILSTLDMSYLGDFSDRSEITYQDIIRSHYSLENTNVTKLLKQQGYNIRNFSMNDMEGVPASKYSRFQENLGMLIDNQTLPGRVSLDIGWNFPYLFMTAKPRDSLIAREVYTAHASVNDALLNSVMASTKEDRDNERPVFYMMHMMISHDPFLYDADGKLNIQDKLGIRPERYIPTLEYSNSVIEKMVDSIQRWYNGKDYVIILQGDHGYKFREEDPMYKEDMCSILYAVYCSDQNYSLWKDDINSVNGFRLLFNKYLRTNFQELPNQSYTLYYR